MHHFSLSFCCGLLTLTLSTVVKDTIDDWLMQMQRAKNADIDKALKERPNKLPLAVLLQIFGQGEEDEGAPDAFIMVEDDDQQDDASDGEVPTRPPIMPY